MWNDLFLRVEFHSHSMSSPFSFVSLCSCRYPNIQSNAYHEHEAVELICEVSDEHTKLCDLLLTERGEDLYRRINEQYVKWTLFAPNDAAFAEIEDEFATLTEDEIERMVLFHAIGEEADVPENYKLYDDLECTEEYEMLSGDNSRTKCIKNEEEGGIWEKYQKGGGNRKNDNLPKIIEADIKACNGVLHVLDAVMLPNFIDKFE